MWDDDYAPLGPCQHDIESDEEEDAVEEGKKEKKDLTIIWDCDKLKRIGKKGNDDKGWFCAWCKQEFKKWNAIKALNHIMRVARSHIVGCKGEIDAKHMTRYAELLKKKDSSKKKAAHAKTCWCNSSEERDARVEPTTLRPECRGTTRLNPRTILDCSRMHTTPRQTSTIGYWSTSDTAGVARAMLPMLGKAGVMGALLTYSYSQLKRRLHRTDQITDSLHFSYFVSFVAL
jgi:hypothetical protein